ncbi:MAG: hypothetical protein QF805_24495, partial [Pirellulaceae bacterium]|nr:hypothetical protein [Pirellulaceae bacterium]
MWSSRLFWKLVLVYGGFNFVLAATFPLALSKWEESQVIDQVRGGLRDIALLVRGQVAPAIAAGDSSQLVRLVNDASQLTDVRVTIIAAGVPAICDHSGQAAGRVNGWPKLVPTDDEGKPNPKILQASRYVDAVNFA